MVGSHARVQLFMLWYYSLLGPRDATFTLRDAEVMFVDLMDVDDNDLNSIAGSDSSRASVTE